ncbi:MAG: MOSC domain-containing protein [Thermoleophilaceae bacterium]
MGARAVGRVVGLWRYPVKSMAAEPLDAVDGSYLPSLSQPSRPDDSPVSVRTPSGDDFDVTDPALAEQLGHGARVIKQGRGVFDSAPLSLITAQTVAVLESSVERDLDIRRFRPNLVVDITEGTPFEEDGWVGSELAIGGMSMRVDRRNERCVIVTVDPETGERDPAVLRSIARERDARLGVYGTTVQPGRVALGDPVSLAGA